MIKCIVTGNAVAEPETRVTRTGKTVCNFTLASNSGRKGAEHSTTYFKCSAWEAKADLCSRYVVKGKKMAIVGTVGSQAYMGKDGKPRSALTITIDDLEFLSSNAEAMEYSMGSTTADESISSTETGEFVQVDEDELPF